MPCRVSFEMVVHQRWLGVTAAASGGQRQREQRPRFEFFVWAKFDLFIEVGALGETSVELDCPRPLPRPEHLEELDDCRAPRPSKSSATVHAGVRQRGRWQEGVTDSRSHCCRVELANLSDQYGKLNPCNVAELV